MALLGAAGTAGASGLFRFLSKTAQILKPNFNNVEAFQRAIKVFYLSYPNTSPESPPFHTQKYQEYIDHISKLYRIDPSHLQNQSIFTIPFDQAKGETISIHFWVKDFIGSDKVENAKMVVRRNTQVMATLTLNQKPFQSQFTNAPFDVFSKFRGNPDDCLLITIEGDNWVQPNDTLNELRYVFAHTNPEGFEDWFDFGRGVQLLIRIQNEVRQELNITREDVYNFHMQTINLMLETRLRAFEDTPVIDTGHKEYSLKKKITFKRPFVTPLTNSMYWTTPPTGLVSGTQLQPQKLSSTVKYVDLQTLFELNDELETDICLCSEWCNWNAFFYYNPIYRFLLIQHKQLLMGNGANLPEMYLALTVIHGCNTALTKLPVLRLMRSANEYRKRYLENYIMRSHQLQGEYRNCYPNPFTMNAVTYNKLRYDLNIQIICHGLDVNPFSDICIEGLTTYYQILKDLHILHSSNTTFVSPQNQEIWDENLDLMSRNKYQQFVKAGYDKCIANDLGGIDYLFTVDFENAKRFAKSLVVEDFRNARNRIMRKSLLDSPLNVRIHLNDYLNTCASIYKFMAKIVPMLPKAYAIEALELLYECHHNMDTDFMNFKTQANKTYTFRVMPTEYPTLERHFYVFYTLKIYFYSFEIQKQCIDSCIDYNIFAGFNFQVSKCFDFFFQNENIEATHTNRYQNNVFPLSPNFNTPFTEFYTTFYGIPSHEKISIANIQTIRNLDTIVNSCFEEHQKLSVWERNDGYQKKKFKNIIKTLETVLNDICDHSDAVTDNWIIPAMEHISHQTRDDVFDHLVFYLVKANCSLILNTIILFFKQIHSLQREDLTEKDISYSLSKPGWLPLLRSMDKFMDAVNFVNNYSVPFDDEFDRIQNTCTQTKKLIKEMYRQLYAKLVNEWIGELNHLAEYANIGQITVNKKATDLYVHHLVIGISFAVSFVDVFRQEFAMIRIMYQRILLANPSPQLLPNPEYSAVTLFIKDFVKDAIAVQNGKPYESDVFNRQRYLIMLKYSFMHLSPQQFNIDLAAADI